MPVNRRTHRSVSDRAAHFVRYGTALGRWTDAFIHELRRRHVPFHWTILFGVVAVAATLTLLLTGIILMFFYTPSNETVVYDGPFDPLSGKDVSKAFDSTMWISLEVPGGLLMRQIHHWAGLLLPAAIICQILVTFFTGGFRRPRQPMWVALCLLLIVALVGGWSGYALPDDLLAGTGLRIVEGIVLGIPVLGTWTAALLFGGEFPGRIIETVYPIHVAVVPAALIVLIAVRARSAYVHRPMQFPGPGRTERNVVGISMWPNAVVRAGGLLALVSGMLVLIGASVTISPVWLYGPASPSDASAGSQPDWYTGFLDGALRLVPPGWEIAILDHTLTLAVLAPLAGVGVFLALVIAYPYLEGWISQDLREHHLLQRPRHAPTRTGIGFAGLTVFVTLWTAGSADVIAVAFQLSFESVIVVLQVTLLLGPILAFSLSRRVAIGLRYRDLEVDLHGFETGRIVRLPGGEYIETHQPVEDSERLRLVSSEQINPLHITPNEDGKLTVLARTRGRIAAWFFEDRITPPQAVGREASTDALTDLAGSTTRKH